MKKVEILKASYFSRDGARYVVVFEEDGTGKCVLVNQLASDWFGVVEDEEVVYLPRPEKFQILANPARVSDVNETYRVFDLEKEIINRSREVVASQEKIQIIVTKTLLRNAEGKKIGVFIVARDLTQEQQRLLAERNAAMRCIHDARNQMNTVVINAEILRGYLADIEQKSEAEELSEIAEAQGRINEIDAAIQNTQLILEGFNARVAALNRSGGAQMQEINFYKMVLTPVKNRLKHQIVKSGAEIIFEESCSAVELFGCRLSLQSAFANLFDNAMKYGGPGVIVTVRAVADGMNWQIIVENNGKGMPEALLPYAFCEDKVGLGQYIGGTGLGLPAVASLIYQQSGDISCRNINKHPVFEIRLPKA